MKVFEFEDYLRGLKIRLRPDEGRHGSPESLNPDEGIVFGSRLDEISSVQVSWAPTLPAIENAASEGASLMVVHEHLFTPCSEMPADYLSWEANSNRLKKLSEAGISVIRLHGTMDAICVFDCFAGALGLGKPAVNGPGYVKLYDIEPSCIENLIKRVKKALGMEKVRVVTPSSPPEKIKRIGLPWGGMGLSVNASYQAELLKHGPDAFITGETDTCAMHFAADSGVYLVETGHDLSENPGIRKFTEKLSDELPEIKINYFENKPPFMLK